MKADFWHDRWAAQKIGFHQRNANALLVAHFAAIGLAPGGRVFVPLCGKTRDIAWLMAQGCRVVGAELSETAVQQLFAEIDIVPEVTAVGALTRYAVEGLDVFIGDIFALTSEDLGHVDAVYDRAALVALPDTMRGRYVDHVVAITGAVRQLVVTFTYDQALMNGPPFSISEATMMAQYDAIYDLQALQTLDVSGGLNGSVPATETAWLLTGKGS
ncbi:MAG: thiopurine S-methyltransferase [Yoonia sp.]|jgi:thiopurine S-methyltransferase